MLLLLEGAPRVLNLNSLLMNRRKNSGSVWLRKLLKSVGLGGLAGLAIFYC